MNPDTLKTLRTSVVSTATGCTVTYPFQNNKAENIESPLDTLVSLVGACQISILRLLSKKHGFKLGKVNITKVESTFNTALLHGEGGPQNKINDVYLEGEVETDLEEPVFREIEKKVRLLCPVFQMFLSSGVNIHTALAVKKLA